MPFAVLVVGIAVLKAKVKETYSNTISYHSWLLVDFPLMVRLFRDQANIKWHILLTRVNM